MTEVWGSEASRDASLSLPAVKNAFPKAKEIVGKFEKVAVTNPVWKVGLPEWLQRIKAIGGSQ